MLNKAADTIAHTYPFPAKMLVKNSTLTLQERGCYFLWLTYSKIAITSIPKVSNTMNSSYVLIENASFRSRLGNGGIHTLSAPRVSILCCHGSRKGTICPPAQSCTGSTDSILSWQLNSGQAHLGFTGSYLGLRCCSSKMAYQVPLRKGSPPDGMPWLLHGALGVVPRGGHSGLPFAGGHTSVKPALPNEDPALIQGLLPQNAGYPCSLLPAPGGGSLCQGVGVLPYTRLWAYFSPLVGMFRHLCLCSSCMRNGALSTDGEWFFHSSSRKSGKFRCTPPTYWIRSYACAGGGIEAVKKQITRVTCFAKLNGIGG